MNSSRILPNRDYLWSVLGNKNVFKSLANLGWSSAIFGKSAQIFSNLQKVIVGGVSKCLGDIRWSLVWFERSLEELGNASGDLCLPSKYPKLLSVAMSVIAPSSDIFVLICTCVSHFHCWYWHCCTASFLANQNQVMCIIIWLGPWAGKMNQILCCHWLPERARWSYLAR